MSDIAYVQFVKEMNRLQAVRNVLDVAQIVVDEWRIRGDGQVSTKVSDRLIEAVSELRAASTPENVEEPT